MKISKEQKAINRQSLLRAGVELMSEVGLKAATMSRIAQKANLSEPVIYKYFPSKDHLLAEYFAETLNRAIEKIESLPDFGALSFTEQLQLLFDAQVAEFEQHKGFVQEAYKQLFLTSLSGSFTYLSDQRQVYLNFVNRLLEAAVAAEEFSPPPGPQLVCELLWDFQIGMTYYWLNDTSHNSSRTLQMLDKSLSLFRELLKSNILARAMDLLYFLAREHFIKAVDSLIPLTEGQKEKKLRFLNQNRKKEDE